MDIHKVTFIICSNDKQETDECVFYLDNLKIPKGYNMEIIPIYGAVSMAEGYNAGMKRSDAKYKVYLHQDTFIINPNFIYELLEVFQSNLEIGILGCVGRRKMPLDGFAVNGWNTGKVYDNLDFFQGYECGNCEVDALDGLMLATQYDIPWREDIFQGWDYYDISQCYEFRRKGFKVVVPEQKEYWCYHDNRSSRLKEYDKWRQKFVEEYQDICPFEYAEYINENKREMEELSMSLAEMLEKYLDRGQMLEFSAICMNPNVKNQLWASEYCWINSIYCAEQNANSLKGIYQGNAKETLNYFRRLKHLLKRVEYDVGNVEEIQGEIEENYSVYAICVVCIGYCRNRKKVYKELFDFYQGHGLKQELDILSCQKVLIEKGDIEPQYMHLLVVPDSEGEEMKSKQVLMIADKMNKETSDAFGICSELRKQYEVCLIVRQYDADVLEKLDQMHIETFYLENPMHLVWDMKDKLYKRFIEIIIIGEDMERIVEQWHRTHIPVKWYVSQGNIEKKCEYSENIQLCCL